MNIMALKIKKLLTLLHSLLREILFADNHHRSSEKRNSSGSHKASSKLEASEIEEILQNSSPLQSEISPPAEDPPEPEELIKVILNR